MKSVYVICTLLGLTIGTLMLADNGMALPVSEDRINTTTPSNSTTESSKQIDNVKTPIPQPVTSGTTILTTAPATSSITTAVPPNTTTTISTSSSTITSTTVSTTPIPTSTSTTITPPTTTSKSTTTSTIAPTSTTTLQTTAIPSTPPSPKDRQFDGLSFFGGIVLTTCLMAIAAFSWRFYKQCKDGSYRTL